MEISVEDLNECYSDIDKTMMNSSRYDKYKS